MRVYQHIIDTMAIKTTLNSIPHHWVVRDLSERDYGVDLMIEIFSKAGTNEKGHDYFEATGHVCYLQLKGTNSEFEYYEENETLSYSIDKSTLLYVERFSTPFILVRVSVVAGKEKVHFLWLQRYIMEVLDFQIPDWRERKRKVKEGEEEEYQESYTIKIPMSNVLPGGSTKIEKIAARIKYIEEHSEFYERYGTVKSYLNTIIDNNLDAEGYSFLRKELSRIKRFDTLFEYNNCCIDRSCVDELLEYVNNTERGLVAPIEDEDFPHNFNFSTLYDESNLRISMEEFIADNDGDTVY